MNENTPLPVAPEQAGVAKEKSLYGHIRSFVLRQGHLSSAQQRHYEQGMPKWGIAYQKAPLDFAVAFGRTAPTILEIGFGMGETTAKIAAANPHNNYLCLEVHTPGVGALLKLIEDNGLSNIRIIQHDAVEVVRDMLPIDVLAGIHIYFPDPWHKKRHNKRRLIQSPFVAELSSRLAIGGYFHCATDWEDYAQQMLAVLSAEAKLENTVTAKNPAKAYAPRSDHRPLTKFEARGNRLGHGVWDVIFKRKF